MSIRARPSSMVFAVLAVMSAAVAGAEEINREFHERFDVHAGMRLRLEHGDGDVNITPWIQDTLAVDVRYRAKASGIGWNKSTDFEVEFRQDGDTIYVIGKEPKHVTVGISAFREYEYLYSIKAPSYLELDLFGDDGDVEIEDWRGAVEMELEDGDVRLTAIEAPRTEIILEDGDLEIDGFKGELLVEAEDGDVDIFDCATERARISLDDGDLTMDRCGGSFEMRASDGDIRLTRLRAEDLEIRIDDGSVDLDLLPAEGLDLNIRAGDGDVVVDLDEGIATAFTIETRDGRIRVNAPEVGGLRKEKHRVSGQLGEGGGNILISSVDGNITLRQ